MLHARIFFFGGDVCPAITLRYAGKRRIAIEEVTIQASRLGEAGDGEDKLYYPVSAGNGQIGDRPEDRRSPSLMKGTNGDRSKETISLHC
jgi:hypothetical protein